MRGLVPWTLVCLGSIILSITFGAADITLDRPRRRRVRRLDHAPDHPEVRVLIAAGVGAALAHFEALPAAERFLDDFFPWAVEVLLESSHTVARRR